MAKKKEEASWIGPGLAGGLGLVMIVIPEPATTLMGILIVAGAVAKGLGEGEGRFA